MNYRLLARIALDVLDTSQHVMNAMWRAWNDSLEQNGPPNAEPPAPDRPHPLNIIQESSEATPPHDEKLLDCNRAGTETDAPMGTSMYNLHKAKEEIDTIAKHTADLAAHVLALGGDMEAKLAAFRTEVMSTIDRKFAELEFKVMGGDGQTIESSAVTDLGAKIALLKGGPAPAAHEHPVPETDHATVAHEIVHDHAAEAPHPEHVADHDHPVHDDHPMHHDHPVPESHPMSENHPVHDDHQGSPDAWR